MVVAVKELEVEADRLLATEDRHDPLTMKLRPSLGRGLLPRNDNRNSKSLASISTLQARAHDLEELLRRRFGEVEGDLVGGKNLLVVHFNRGGGGGVGGEGEERGDEGRGEGGVVEVDEALGDGEVVGRGEGGEELDEEVKDLWWGQSS